LIDKSVHADLIERVTSHEEDERMPPEGARLTSSQVETLKHWFADGAPFPSDEVIPKKPSEHWSFQPVKRPQVPGSASKHPIDAFVFGKHDPPPQAAPMALLRRIHLDLTGLPPTIAEQDAFTHQSHSSHQSYQAVIDDLLTRPEYGERWARHWLDVVRYADSNGYERDAEKPFVWRYRDYVIEALNKTNPSTASSSSSSREMNCLTARSKLTSPLAFFDSVTGMTSLLIRLRIVTTSSTTSSAPPGRRFSASPSAARAATITSSSRWPRATTTASSPSSILSNARQRPHGAHDEDRRHRSLHLERDVRCHSEPRMCSCAARPRDWAISSSPPCQRSSPKVGRMVLHPPPGPPNAASASRNGSPAQTTRSPPA
jgi:hypothetical protein